MGMNSATRLACAAIALLLSTAASAVEIEGVTLAERVHSGSDGPRLVLNGAGVRRQLIFKIYIAALYLPVTMNNGEEILRHDQPRRLTMHMLRALTSEQLTASMNDALRDTLTPGERLPLESRMRQFNAILASLHEVKRGMQIAIDYLPQSGTTVLVDGHEKGRIPGKDFNQALLRMWIGAHPKDTELRFALLGVGRDPKYLPITGPDGLSLAREVDDPFPVKCCLPCPVA